MGRPRQTGKNLPPCVYEKHGAFYLVKGGKWTKIGTTLDEVRAYEASPSVVAGTMPDLIWKVYEMKRPKLAHSTALAYKTAAKKLATIFAHYRPEQVKMRDVAQMKLALAATPAMSNETVGFLRGVFDYAVEHQLVDHNPCVGIKRLEVNRRRRCPTDDELRAILAVSGERLRVIIELLLLTGQRVNDVLKIRRDQITEQGIRFKQQKTGNPLLILWNAELRAAYDRARALSGDVASIYLLAGPRGAPAHYRTVHTLWAEALKKAGVEDLHIHDLRAKSVTTAKLQGLDPQAVAGHTTAAQTLSYIRVRDEPQVTGPSFAGVLDGN